MRRIDILVAPLALLGAMSAHARVGPQADALPLSCATFSANASESALRDRFGADNVQTAQVPWGGSGTPTFLARSSQGA